MGIFDGSERIAKLGNTIVANLATRCEELQKKLSLDEVRKDPGQSLAIKVAIFTMQNLAEVIQASTAE